MRYDTPVYFQLVERGEYDTTTGNYGEPTETEVKKYASVSDVGTDTMMLIYGAIKQGSKVIRLQQPFTSPFNRIRIAEGIHKGVYHLDREKRFRNAHIFIVSGV